MIDARAPRALLLLAILGAVACNDDDFPSYERLEGLRVLAVQADPPGLRPGDTAILRALVFDEEDESGQLEDVRYAWSWCPVRLPSELGAECLLEEEELAALLGDDSISYDLGEGPTAELSHTIPIELLESLCSIDADAGDGDGDGDGTRDFVLDCDQGLPLSVKLVVRRGDAEITAVKDVRLRLDDEQENNPRIDGVLVAPIPPGVDEDDVREEDAEPIADDGSTAVRLRESVRLFADVPADASEEFVKAPDGFDTEPRTKQENLFISWFSTSGGFEKERTAFTEGSNELEAIRPNTWNLPRGGDEENAEATLILVIRDERGGVDWLVRTLELER